MDSNIDKVLKETPEEEGKGKVLQVTLENGSKFFINYDDWKKHNDWGDWGAFHPAKYYEKYPESKPDFPPTRVLIDEADKKPR